MLTVFLTLGAWRISRRNVLTRQVAAIENLGTATVLCTDKTGTLTLNRMAVTQTPCRRRNSRCGQTAGHTIAPKFTAAHVLAAAARRARSGPLDPMERAFHRQAADTASRWLREI